MYKSSNFIFSTGILLLLFCFLFIPFTFAGKFNDFPAFGKVSKAELEMDTYEPDPGAGAVILFDEGKSVVEFNEAGIVLLYEKRTRIKILSKEGLDWGNVEIPYYKSGQNTGEKIMRLKAFTYNLSESGDIEKTGLPQEDIINNEMRENWYEQVFPMPNVRIGSVLEYKYMIRSTYLFSLREWQFQYDIPVQKSYYEVVHPDIFQYAILEQGYINFDVYSNEKGSLMLSIGSLSYKRQTRKWGAKDIPALKDEAFITTSDDLVSKVEFQLNSYAQFSGLVKEVTNTWPNLSNDLYSRERYNRYQKKVYAAEKVAEWTKGLSTPTEKAQAIYTRFQREAFWNDIETIYPGKEPKEMEKKFIGNTADLSLMLFNMMNQAGVRAYPVVLSTRSHGRIQRNYPFVSKFNYMVVLINLGDQQFLLDPTEKMVPFGVLPARCLNGAGLALRRGDPYFVPLLSTTTSVENTQTILSMDPDSEEMTSTVRCSFKGEAARLRREANAESEDELKEYLWGEEISEVNVTNAEDLTKPLSVVYKKKPKVEEAGNLLIIEPFDAAAFRENPLTAPERKFPLNFGYTRMYTLTLNLQVPAGYAIDELPETSTGALVDQSFGYVYQVQEVGGTAVQAIFRIVINADQISALRYDDVKGIFDEISGKFHEPIVLKKK